MEKLFLENSLAAGMKLLDRETTATVYGVRFSPWAALKLLVNKFLSSLYCFESSVCDTLPTEVCPKV